MWVLDGKKKVVKGYFKTTLGMKGLKCYNIRLGMHNILFSKKR